MISDINQKGSSPKKLKMFKFVVVWAFATSVVLAAPKPSGILAAAPLALAPAVAPAVVTAQSSQVVARNYNALVAPVVAPAPVVAAAPLVAPAPVLAHAPVVAPAPVIASSYRVAAPAFASPYLATPGVVSPYLW